MHAKKKLVRIKEITLNSISSSTTHGLPKLISSERLSIKIIWLVFFLLFLSLGFIMIVGTIMDYMDRELVTKIEVITESISPFPTVTFFNLRKLNKVYKLNETILSCSFNEEDTYDKCIDLVEMKHDEFNNTYFRFNYKKNAKAIQSGRSNGLKLNIFAGFPDSYESLPEEIKSNSSLFLSPGFRVIVHSESNDPGISDGSSYEGIDIPFGFETTLTIEKVLIKKAPFPYNNCYGDLSSPNSFDSDLFRKILKEVNYTYRQRDCFRYCLANQLIQKCKLNDTLVSDNVLWKRHNWYYDSEKKREKFCEVDLDNNNNKLCDAYRCMLNVSNNLIEENKGVIELCSPECPLECDSISYSVIASFANYPLKLLNGLNYWDYMDKLEEKLNISAYSYSSEEIQKHTISFNVQFNTDMRYTKITEIPKTSFKDLVSNVGGIFGLFLGISFLSFIELFELLIEVFIILCEKKPKREIKYIQNNVTF